MGITAANDDEAVTNGKDQRWLVLLALGVVIFFLGYYQNFVEKRQIQKKIDSPPIIIWLSGENSSEGLHLFPADTVWGDIYTQVGVPLPNSDSLIDNTPETLKAYHIKKEKIPVPSSLPAKVAPLFFLPISLNNADPILLASIPGIGPKLAEKIIIERNFVGKFNDLGQLLNVPGIGPKKLARFRKHLVVN